MLLLDTWEVRMDKSTFPCSGRLRQFILEIEEKVYYKELFFVKKSCQLYIIFHKMYFKQEYLSSDNIITMVPILVCALTVTKYDLP